MRIPNAVHEAGAWRIRDIVPDFTLEDVWALPVHGGADDFDALVDDVIASDPANSPSLPTRVLWRARDRLGGWLGLGRTTAQHDNDVDGSVRALPIPGTDEISLAGRLPDDLRGTAADLHFACLPFTPLYLTDTEFAAELSNQTVHGLMHLVWVDEGAGRYQGRMAVYVKPRGAFGKGYMAAIRPFRHWVVYPALMRQMERSWTRRDGRPPAIGRAR